MRGFLLGLVLIPILVIAVLSVRPGGLRNQLRNVGRRLRLALILGGVYLVSSTVLRLLFPGKAAADFAIVAIALVLTAIFIFLGQDRQLER